MSETGAEILAKIWENWVWKYNFFSKNISWVSGAKKKLEMVVLVIQKHTKFNVFLFCKLKFFDSCIHAVL